MRSSAKLSWCLTAEPKGSFDETGQCSRRRNRGHLTRIHPEEMFSVTKRPESGKDPNSQSPDTPPRSPHLPTFCHIPTLRQTFTSQTQTLAPTSIANSINSSSSASSTVSRSSPFTAPSYLAFSGKIGPAPSQIRTAEYFGIWPGLAVVATTTFRILSGLRWMNSAFWRGFGRGGRRCFLWWLMAWFRSMASVSCAWCSVFGVMLAMFRSRQAVGLIYDVASHQMGLLWNHVLGPRVAPSTGCFNITQAASKKKNATLPSARKVPHSASQTASCGLCWRCRWYPALDLSWACKDMDFCDCCGTRPCYFPASLLASLPACSKVADRLHIILNGNRACADKGENGKVNYLLRCILSVTRRSRSNPQDRPFKP